MNYKEFQKLNQKESKILPGDPKKFGRKHKPPFNLGNFLAEAANPLSLLAVISMVAFFRNHPEIPMILSLLTGICFYIRYQKNKCPIWLPAVWLFNTLVWSFNTIIKL